MTEPTRDPVEELAASLRAMDAPPDDMTRERMARQLREAIAAPLRTRRSWAPLVAVGALAAGDCARAAPLFEEFLRLYPTHAFAGAARDGVRRCR